MKKILGGLLAAALIGFITFACTNDEAPDSQGVAKISKKEVLAKIKQDLAA